MEFKRKITEKLAEELAIGNKPILLIGARQIGKTTTIINYLKQQNSNYLYLNLDSDPAARAVFDEDFNIERIILELSIIYRMSGFDTVVLDEIQECPRALTSLKYFQEISDIKVICAASGLGVTINHFGHSFPVGKVKILKMHPMSFLEFLEATGEQMLLEMITRLDYKSVVNPALHKVLLLKFDMYMMVSGYP